MIDQAMSRLYKAIEPVTGSSEPTDEEVSTAIFVSLDVLGEHLENIERIANALEDIAKSQRILAGRDPDMEF